MKSLLAGLMLLILVGCKNGKQENLPAPQTDTVPQKEKAYFPVFDFLQSEIRYVDSLPVGILRYTTKNGSTDSGYIKSEEFHQLAGEFLSPVLTKETFEKEFKETSFFDNSTKFSTFLYSTENRSLPIQRVNVLVQPENAVFSKVKSIYMEKFSENGDSSFVRKMYWKAGQNFQINTEIKTSSAEAITQQVKVVWNPFE